MKSILIRKAAVVAGLAAMIGTGSAALASATTIGAPVQTKHHYNPPPNPVPCNLPAGSVCIRSHR